MADILIWIAVIAFFLISFIIVVFFGHLMEQ